MCWFTQLGRSRCESSRSASRCSSDDWNLILSSSALCFALCGFHFQAGTPQVVVRRLQLASAEREGLFPSHFSTSLRADWCSLALTGLHSDSIPTLWSMTMAIGKQYPNWPGLGHISTFWARRHCLRIPNSGRNKIPTSCFIRRRNRCLPSKKNQVS